MLLDMFAIEWEGMVYQWSERVDELKKVSGDFNHGLLHAHQEVLRTIDENVMLEYMTELEIQTKELLGKCEREASAIAISEYGRGYAEGMHQCAFALKKLIAETVG